MTVSENDIEDGTKEIGKDRNKEKTETDGSKKRNGEETVMARRRYVVTVTTPAINEETAEAFKIMNQMMGFNVTANSQDGEEYGLLLVLKDAAKQIPTEKEQMTD